MTLWITAIRKRFRRLRNRQINLRQYIIDALTRRLKISTFVSKASKKDRIYHDPENHPHS